MDDIKLLVLDIDGTLTNSKKEISPETKRAIKLIQERGHKVMLASGRPTPGMRRFEKELEFGQVSANYDINDLLSRAVKPEDTL